MQQMSFITKQVCAFRVIKSHAYNIRFFFEFIKFIRASCPLKIELVKLFKFVTPFFFGLAFCEFNE
jgi:hypothetical protein